MNDTFWHRLATVFAAMCAGIAWLLSGRAAVLHRWDEAVGFAIFGLLLSARGIAWAITGEHRTEWILYPRRRRP